MTEKDYNPEQRNAKSMAKPVKTSKKTDKVDSPVKKLVEAPKEEKIENVNEKVVETKDTLKDTSDVKVEAPKEEKKITKPKEKKTEAVVNSHSLPISTKHSVAVCKFIKHKRIETAIANLQQVITKKKAIPMKGEIPHRKGRIMSGRFPKNAAEHFIKVLKTLTANANVNGLTNPVISEAIANLAQRPRGKGGRIKKKRTHVKIVAVEKSSKKEKKK